MAFLTASVVPLIAQAAGGGGAGGNAPTGGSFLPTLLMFLPMIILFWLLILRPQQQQERQRQKMIEALKKNDKVLTAAGIYGTVVSIDTEKDQVIVRVDDDRGVKLAFTKGSVARVIDTTSAAGKDKEKGGDLA